ncbi:hypothetical protein DICVIV_02551 [Dictyocaulus viviparus]|uniref:Uncharacterized protein n=1 Tax=Dictyocaulus viviparus TaxID=29172 RepID=A0A0D8Y521_DICVI|nr:hypothetical protein DICVIV_02551 [Dictyocaulus viviparus]
MVSHSQNADPQYVEYNYIINFCTYSIALISEDVQCSASEKSNRPTVEADRLKINNNLRDQIDSVLSEKKRNGKVCVHCKCDKIDHELPPNQAGSVYERLGIKPPGTVTLSELECDKIDHELPPNQAGSVYERLGIKPPGTVTLSELEWISKRNVLVDRVGLVWIQRLLFVHADKLIHSCMDVFVHRNKLENKYEQTKQIRLKFND